MGTKGGREITGDGCLKTVEVEQPDPPGTTRTPGGATGTGRSEEGKTERETGGEPGRHREEPTEERETTGSDRIVL